MLPLKILARLLLTLFESMAGLYMVLGSLYLEFQIRNSDSWVGLSHNRQLIIGAFQIVLIASQVLIFIYLGNLLNEKVFNKKINQILLLSFFFTVPFILWSILVAWKFSAIQIKKVETFIREMQTYSATKKAE